MEQEIKFYKEFFDIEILSTIFLEKSVFKHCKLFKILEG